MSWIPKSLTFSGSTENPTQTPLRIFGQILLLQAFYYLIALVSFFLLAQLDGYHFSIDWVFSWKLIDASNALGLTLFILWLFDSLLCVLFVTIVVGRSKLAWDFAVTVHVINLVVVWLYTGTFPSSMLWWCLQILSGVILVTLSTYFTRWKELRTTFFDEMLENGEGRVPRDSIPMRDLGNSSRV